MMINQSFLEVNPAALAKAAAPAARFFRRLRVFPLPCALPG